MEEEAISEFWKIINNKWKQVRLLCGLFIQEWLLINKLQIVY